MKGSVRMAIVLGLLGIASILYGVTIMMVNSGTAFFAVWYVLGAALLIAAGATHAGLWEQLPAALRWAGGCLLAIAGVAVAVTCGLMASQFDAQGEDGLDYIIVLGAQVRPDGSPSSVLKYRLDAAAAYLQANPDTRCIVSGGRGPNEPMAEADGMAAYLEAHGVDPARIIRERQSQNTVQNIAHSQGFLNADRDTVGIVTNNFHVFRATRIAQKAGIVHVCGISAYSHPWYLPNNMLRESMGILKDCACGNI